PVPNTFQSTNDLRLPSNPVPPSIHRGSPDRSVLILSCNSSEQVRYGVERNPRGCSLVSAEHGCRRQRAQPVLLVKLIHRRKQPGPALLVLGAIEEAQAVQTVRHQASQLHADKIRMLKLA